MIGSGNLLSLLARYSSLCRSVKDSSGVRTPQICQAIAGDRCVAFTVTKGVPRDYELLEAVDPYHEVS